MNIIPWALTKGGGMKRPRAGLPGLALSLLYFLLPAFSQAQAFPQTQNSFFPIDLFVFIPCAADGEGEWIELTGQLHDRFHVTMDSSGGFLVDLEDNPQAVKGIGQTTGEKYEANGMTKDQIRLKAGFQETYVNNFRIIGQGPASDFLIHDNFHMTITADGQLFSFHENFSGACK